MNNTISYKGYVGTVEFSEPDGVFFGKILGVQGLFLYEGKDADSLVADFHQMVDDYLSDCEKNHTAPERPYKGSFNVRIDPELHRRAAVTAINQQISLNTFVERAIAAALAKV